MKGTSSTATTPEEYIAELEEPRRTDIGRLHARIRDVAPSLEPHIDRGMLAYGHYTYRYNTGRSGEWFVLGIASNKQYISLYASPEGVEQYADELPKANLGKGCIRFKRLDDLDPAVVDEVIRTSAAWDGRHFTT